tara:strand:+ start:486 stop:1259 length:774 start_codon:yes stop_codon:yes gene_type:complete
MAKPTDISEAKIRQAIWMIKAKKTKKAVCEHLGIAYNTKRLDAIIQEFHDKQKREAELKKKARNKIFTKAEKQGIADSYMAGDAQSAIAKQFYVSPQRIKKILLEMNVPIRARGKNKSAQVDHIVQDLEVKFSKGDKVFFGDENSFAKVYEVYDEDYLERVENGKQKYVEIYPFKPGRNGKAGKYLEPAQGIHYEIYWMIGDAVLPTWKLDAFLQHRDKISKVIEETGRESYMIYKQDDYGGYRFVTREQLFPVKAG